MFPPFCVRLARFRAVSRHHWNAIDAHSHTRQQIDSTPSIQCSHVWKHADVGGATRVVHGVAKSRSWRDCLSLFSVIDSRPSRLARIVPRLEQYSLDSDSVLRDANLQQMDTIHVLWRALTTNAQTPKSVLLQPESTSSMFSLRNVIGMQTHANSPRIGRIYRNASPITYLRDTYHIESHQNLYSAPRAVISCAIPNAQRAKVVRVILAVPCICCCRIYVVRMEHGLFSDHRPSTKYHANL